MWIAQFTDSPDDEISIALGANAGVQSVEGVGATYVSPDSKRRIVSMGGLAQNAYKAIWIKRVVTASANGYTTKLVTGSFGSCTRLVMRLE
ncbi:hypothetical protein [Methanococcoides sp.]|uniref:hypothetical protein n=1 Tax=Methanococcoides sp. TaxID=1966350 RepID=UPI00272E1FEE|nr:hypothetical protein [Methanococcoides sp.]